MISLFSLWMAGRPATKRLSFGWYRAEVIGALTSVIMIWAVTGVLVYMAILRMINKEYNIQADIMLVSATVGVIVNIIMGLALQIHPVRHNHRTGTEAPPERHDGVMNLNVRAAFIHVLGDLIQSVGVLLAAIIIYFCPNCGVVDPICTLLFSVIVLVTTLAILKEALNVLMEGIPRSVDYHQVRAMLLSVQGVARVHDLHIWSLSLDKLAVSAHVVLVPGANSMEVRRNASRAIRRSFDVFKLTLQMEEYEEGIRHHCRQCIEPN
ncbi:zinc transporter 2-like [Ixodes scapularis]|uniref:zinc transporter 2-like n=1 Tax=Ixodes scapularis TaxID=6945 RepID=UPI001A9FCB82|nr:zinc transporter 2-like [Ixodes scapularis]